jgi:hypothetical protein
VNQQVTSLDNKHQKIIKSDLIESEHQEIDRVEAPEAKHDIPAQETQPTT